MKKIGNSPLSELISFAEDELTHNVKSTQRRKVVLKESPADDEWVRNIHGVRIIFCVTPAFFLAIHSQSEKDECIR